MATFPSGMATQTQLTVFEPNVWADRINDFLKNDLVIASFFTNRSQEISGGGKTLETPNMASTAFPATAKADGTAVSLTQNTETKIQLTIDQHFESSYAIQDREAAQVKQSFYLQNAIAKNTAYAIANKLDAALATLFSGFSNVVGLSTIAPVDSDIRKAIGIYEGANNRPEDGAFFFDTKVVWNGLMGIDRFVLNINTPSGDPVGRGRMGSLYGYEVRGSNNIQYVASTSGRNNALASKDALHWAAAPLPALGENVAFGEFGVRTQSNYIPDYLCTIITSDILYGVVENRDTSGVLFRTKAY